MFEIIGGLDWDRTDDLFHAMEALLDQTIDCAGLTNRHSRQNRHNGRYLRAKCGQTTQQVAKGADRVESAPPYPLLLAEFLRRLT